MNLYQFFAASIDPRWRSLGQLRLYEDNQWINILLQAERSSGETFLFKIGIGDLAHSNRDLFRE